MWVRLEPTRVKQLSAAPLQGRLLDLPTYIRLGWKSLRGTNTLPYLKNSWITNKKTFITLVPGSKFKKITKNVFCLSKKIRQKLTFLLRKKRNSQSLLSNPPPSPLVGIEFIKLWLCQIQGGGSLGNCDIRVRQKISFINEMKRDEISLKPKVKDWKWFLLNTMNSR